MKTKVTDEQLLSVVSHLDSPTIRELQARWKAEFGQGVITSRASEFKRRYFSKQKRADYSFSLEQATFDLKKSDEEQISFFEKEIEENSNRISELQNRNKELRSELSVLKMKASYESRIRELEEENSLLKKQFFEAHENKFHSSPKETHIETEIGTVDWDEYERLQEEEQERNNFLLLEQFSDWWNGLGNTGYDYDGGDNGPYNDVSDSLLNIATSVKSVLKYTFENPLYKEELANDDGTLIISDNSPKPIFKETAEALLERSELEQFAYKDFRPVSSKDFRKVLILNGISEVLFFKTHASSEKAYSQNLCEGIESCLGWHVKLPGERKFRHVGNNVVEAFEYLSYRGYISSKK